MVYKCVISSNCCSSLCVVVSNAYRWRVGPFLTAEPAAAALERVLDTFHQCFVGCFHAFYPTGRLKWLCLCELLTLRETVSTRSRSCLRPLGTGYPGIEMVVFCCSYPDTILMMLWYLQQLSDCVSVLIVWRRAAALSTSWFSAAAAE